MNYNYEKYKDIINISHHVSKKHPQMSIYARAAQFAPFAALNGYEEEIKETARQTIKRKSLDEEFKKCLDIKFQEIRKQIGSKPKVTVTFFLPDLIKDGGEYVTVTGNIKKIDEYRHLIILEDKREIPIEEISQIE